MARWRVTISGKGVRRETVQKLADSLKDKYGEGANVHVEDATPPESRSERFDAALGEAESAKSSIEDLRDELQEWHGNLPENLQSGDKADQIQAAIDELEGVISSLDEAVGASVKFPGMY